MSGLERPLTGWQRAHVLNAAEYVRDILVRKPEDARARAVFEGLLEVLDPTRHLSRQHREQQRVARTGRSMWEQRSGRERRQSDRRKVDPSPAVARERRMGQRRSGRDRRKG